MRELTDASSDSTANTSSVMAGSIACISASGSLSKRHAFVPRRA